jgi:hypothetical protein
MRRDGGFSSIVLHPAPALDGPSKELWACTSGGLRTLLHSDQRASPAFQLALWSDRLSRQATSHGDRRGKANRPRLGLVPPPIRRRQNVGEEQSC